MSYVPTTKEFFKSRYYLLGKENTAYGTTNARDALVIY